jgi:biotin operon repressor
MDQPKLERLLRLMKMLTTNNLLTMVGIANKLGISSRSVYLYINTSREAGFVIKKSNNCPKLDKSSLISPTAVSPPQSGKDNLWFL